MRDPERPTETEGGDGLNREDYPDRRGTSSIKWDKYHGQKILPMWIADMDIVSPPSIMKALHDRIAHGVLGYTRAPDSLVEAIRHYFKVHYAWSIEREWLVFLPGLVQGLHLACRAVGNPGDQVLTMVPIYPPFLQAPGHSGRELVEVPLKLANGRWLMDLDDLESRLTPKSRLLMLCNPHNPSGRAWDLDELLGLIEIAKRHGLTLCSDEIHCDLILDSGRRHVPLAALDEAADLRTITLMSPSKTYNIAGLGCSFAVIEDPSLRRRFLSEMAGLVPQVNLLGYTAAEAAYRDDGAWRSGLIRHLKENRNLLVDFFEGSKRMIMSRPEATYLGWIDARGLHPTAPLAVVEAAGVGLSDGRDFGSPGYLRINFGCSTETLLDAMNRLRPLL